MKPITRKEAEQKLIEKINDILARQSTMEDEELEAYLRMGPVATSEDFYIDEESDSEYRIRLSEFDEYNNEEEKCNKEEI